MANERRFAGNTADDDADNSVSDSHELSVISQYLQPIAGSRVLSSRPETVPLVRDLSVTTAAPVRLPGPRR